MMVETPLQQYNTISAAANSSGLTGGTLDTQGAIIADAFITVGGAATVVWEFSADGTTWHTFATYTYTGATTDDNHTVYNGYRYTRLRSATTGVALTFTLSAK